MCACSESFTCQRCAGTSLDPWYFEDDHEPEPEPPSREVDGTWWL